MPERRKRFEAGKETLLVLVTTIKRFRDEERNNALKVWGEMKEGLERTSGRR
jgi:hypothetical protein